MNSQDNNKLIAEFMHPEMVDFDPNNNDGIEISYNMLAKMAIVTKQYGLLKYHELWDWLMPVVEKIENMEDIKFAVIITQNVCSIKYSDIRATTYKPIVSIASDYSGDNTKLSNTYKAIVKFIKWYNEKSNQQSEVTN